MFWLSCRVGLNYFFDFMVLLLCINVHLIGKEFQCIYEFLMGFKWLRILFCKIAFIFRMRDMQFFLKFKSQNNTVE